MAAGALAALGGPAHDDARAALLALAQHASPHRHSKVS